MNPRGVKHVVATCAKVIGLTSIFVSAAATGVVLHLNLNTPRQFAIARVNSILAGTFRGRVAISQIGSLHLSRIRNVNADVFDPEGLRVIHVQGLSAQIGVGTLVRSLIAGDAVLVRITEVTIDDLDVALAEDARGELNLKRTFESPTKRTAPEKSSPGTDVSIRGIHVTHGWVHGGLSSVPIIDADLHDYDGAFGSTPETTQIDVDKLHLITRGMRGISPVGDLVAHATLPAKKTNNTIVKSIYHGQIGSIPVSADLSLEGKRIQAVVDIQETAPDAVAAIAPQSIHLTAPVSAHAEVSGTLPILYPTLTAEIGSGRIDASGSVHIADDTDPDTRANVHVALTNIDAAALHKGAPSSQASADLYADVVVQPDGKLRGIASIDHHPGTIKNIDLPIVHAQTAFTETLVDANIQVHEPGAPTAVSARITPRNGESKPTQLDFAVDTHVADLRNVARAAIGNGRLGAFAHGTVDLEKSTFMANATAEASQLSTVGLQVDHALVDAQASGAFDAPVIAAHVRGSHLKVAGYDFLQFAGNARGSHDALNIGARLIGNKSTPNIAAHGLLSAGEGIEVRGTDVTIDRRDVKGHLRVALVRVAGGVTTIRGARLLGLGEPVDASARIAGTDLQVRAKGTDIDIARVTKLIGRNEETSGHLALDVHFGTQNPRNNIVVSTRDVVVQGVPAVDINANLGSTNRQWSGSISLKDERVGSLLVNLVNLKPHGSPLDATAWKRASGNINVDGNLDLAGLLDRVPQGKRPVAEAGGRLSLSAKAERPSHGRDGSVTLHIATAGLVVTGNQDIVKNQDDSVTVTKKPFHSEGVDANVTFAIAEATNHSELTTELTDSRGQLARLVAKTALPLAELANGPNRWQALLGKHAIEAHVAIPARGINTLPQVQTPIEGNIALEADFKGTLIAPKLTASARIIELRGHGSGRCDAPLNAEATLTYDGKNVDVRADASSKGERVMTSKARAQLDLSTVLAGAAPGWSASGEVSLSKFPIDLMGALLRKKMSGDVSGNVILADLKRAAKLNADLDLHMVALERTLFETGKLKVDLKEGALSAEARLNQSDGYFAAKATSGVNWGAELSPTLNAQSAADFNVTAKNFRIDAVKPFVESVISELDGRIDSNAHLRLIPGKESEMDGALTIHDGVVQVPQVGDKFHAVQGRITMKPWGTLRFDDFSAKASTGSVSMAGYAELAGFDLKNAEAKMNIRKGESLPIAIEGVPFGKVQGVVTVSAKSVEDGKHVAVVADVPNLKVDLPQTTGNSVQPLEPDPDVRIGYQNGGDFVAIPLSKPIKPQKASDRTIAARVKLGNVEVKRDTTLDVFTQGEITIDVREKSHVGGQIRLVRGRLDLQGKMFTVDSGTVSFVDDNPANPLIVANAYWDAPNGTRVHAAFVGKPKGGKLTLRSEPALSQDEILALVLFGSTDGALGIESKSSTPKSTADKAAGAAGGVAGGALTQGVNRILSGVSAVDISTRIDTSDANSPRPELTIPLTPRISTTVSYKLGVPSPGDNPDRVEVTLDWRFIRNWSLSTVVGDQGSTAVDLLWRLRY